MTVDSHLSKQQFLTYVTLDSNMFSHVKRLLLFPATIIRHVVLDARFTEPEVQSSTSYQGNP
jgi:hypothetical protein